MILPPLVFPAVNIRLEVANSVKPTSSNAMKLITTLETYKIQTRDKVTKARTQQKNSTQKTELTISQLVARF